MPSTARFPCTALLVAFLVAVACSDGPTSPDPGVTALAFTSQPAADWATKPLSGVTVTAQDGHGGVITGYNREISLTLQDGTAGAQLTGTRTVQAVRGVATFSDIAVDRAGTGFRLAAHADGVPENSSERFDVAPQPRLVFTTAPSTYRIDLPLAPAVQVTAEDSTGATVTNFNDAVTLAIDGVSLSGSPSVTATNGVARFTGVGIPQEGAGLILRATSPYVTAAASQPFSSQPVLSITTPLGTVRSGVPITTDIEVALRDVGGTIATNFNGPVTLILSSTVSGMALGGTATVNAVNGTATFTGLSFSRPGTAVLFPSADGYAGKSREIRVDCFESCWRLRSPAHAAQYGPNLAALGDKLYLVGGLNDDYEGVPDLLEYDPATDAWTPRAPMHAGHYWLSVVSLDGRLYAIGTDFGETHSTLEIYDPATDTWTAGASMPDDRRYYGAAAANEHIYVVGGVHDDGNVSVELASTMVYDPATNLWSEGPAMNTARSSPLVTALGGQLLVAGGYDGSDYTDNTTGTAVELLDPGTGQWSAGPVLPRRNSWAITSNDEQVYVVIAPDTDLGIPSPVFRLDVAGQSWQELAQSPDLEPDSGARMAITGNTLFVLHFAYLWSYAPLP
jgi:hypothetical protein